MLPVIEIMCYFNHKIIGIQLWVIQGESIKHFKTSDGGSLAVDKKTGIIYIVDKAGRIVTDTIYKSK